MLTFMEAVREENISVTEAFSRVEQSIGDSLGELENVRE